MVGIPRSVGPVRRLRSMLRSRLASLRLAAFRLTSRPWTSPSQPFIRASVMRSRRLWMMSVRRGRCCGDTLAAGSAFSGVTWPQLATVSTIAIAARVLASTATGLSPGSNTSNNQYNVEAWQINTIADILAAIKERRA